MITIRKPDDVFNVGGPVARGTFKGLWHFSFDRFYDPQYVHFGTLRVFNDDTISPGGQWGIHPHRRNEVLTYVMHGWGVYLANLEGGNLNVNEAVIPERGAAKIDSEKQIRINAVEGVELLLLEVLLKADYIG